ncbi:protein of unknown function DUF924 [Thioalkalivibrio nitratireducens DSM 14787]|uniref:Transmembrane protein n=1 Tax=Thioalkalivibrio nitratireducens (strain DSM 14787 / UNIQEM 213 / ALEN2) TaxID=1255043 RepID=L0DYK1_THIND|nr:DUF924 family protein [Thioalkalivibrio nitratireducens]AGA34040.1 protein of unknown function DUF924 [Thioalkalivibrio nitratireducens DSM 14787]
MRTVQQDCREILEFWFSEDVRPFWFRSTPEFDQQLRGRFRGVWETAARGGLEAWLGSADGTLALVIVLDQFPLNMFRGHAKAFSTEARARDAADHAIRQGWDRAMDDARKGFLYLPFMHSESLDDQDRSVRLYREAGLTGSLRWAGHHRGIIRRFGRFPHRNTALGRVNTPEEVAWLASKEAFRG